MVNIGFLPCFNGVSALLVCMISNFPSLSTTNQPQPEPNKVVAALANASFLRGGTQYLKAEHKRGKEPDELVTARIEVGDQMELLF